MDLNLFFVSYSKLSASLCPARSFPFVLIRKRQGLTVSWHFGKVLFLLLCIDELACITKKWEGRIVTRSRSLRLVLVATWNDKQKTALLTRNRKIIGKKKKTLVGRMRKFHQKKNDVLSQHFRKNCITGTEFLLFPSKSNIILIFFSDILRLDPPPIYDDISVSWG